ncbi:MAG: HAD-IA family hydrolase, partial [candidate division Zixibacteria bacterium]|nr:HAD-IA family hydrolase [candidate division Zixibacteria bacterium]
FAALVGCDEVEHVKPAPDAFHLALRRMGAEAADALVVGDTINDIYAAHAVPMIAVAVEPLYDGRDELLSSRPDYMIADVAALPSFLESGAYRG